MRSRARTYQRVRMLHRVHDVMLFILCFCSVPMILMCPKTHGKTGDAASFSDVSHVVAESAYVVESETEIDPSTGGGHALRATASDAEVHSSGSESRSLHAVDVHEAVRIDQATPSQIEEPVIHVTIENVGNHRVVANPFKLDYEEEEEALEAVNSDSLRGVIYHIENHSEEEVEVQVTGQLSMNHREEAVTVDRIEEIEAADIPSLYIHAVAKTQDGYVGNDGLGGYEKEDEEVMRLVFHKEKQTMAEPLLLAAENDEGAALDLEISGASGGIGWNSKYADFQVKINFDIYPVTADE